MKKRILGIFLALAFLLPVIFADGLGGGGWTSLTLGESREISLGFSESDLLTETLGAPRELSLELSQESGWPEDTFRLDVLLDDPDGVTDFSYEIAVKSNAGQETELATNYLNAAWLTDFVAGGRTVTEQWDDSADDPVLSVLSEGDPLTKTLSALLISP
jgi:hypothetical protein